MFFWRNGIFTNPSNNSNTRQDIESVIGLMTEGNHKWGLQETSEKMAKM